MLDPVVRAKVQFVCHLQVLVLPCPGDSLILDVQTKNTEDLFVHIPKQHLISELVSAKFIVFAQLTNGRLLGRRDFLELAL